MRPFDSLNLFNVMSPIIYLDHAATTAMDPRVLDVMKPYFLEEYGNPSSFHTLGMHAKDAVTEAREQIASLIGAHEDEVLFTSGGTESNMMALAGVIQYHGKDILPHVITSSIEHHAILEPLMVYSRKKQIELTILDVDRTGMVAVKDVVEAMKATTVLVSIMTANNEIGTIQPIGDIGREILKWRKEHSTIYPLLHSDACQAAAYLDLNVEKSHVDLLTVNAGKIYGPKGVGMLFVRRGVKLAPFLIGGGQQRGLRSGTENVPGIVGFAKALSLVCERREEESARLIGLRDRLAKGL